MNGSPTDTDIIERSLEDPESFALIFDRHADPIHRYLARRAGTAVADDLLTEVFRVGFEVRFRYRLERTTALPWLYGIAANVLRQSRRTEFRQARTASRLTETWSVETDEVTTLVEALYIRDDLAVTMKALESLPDADRETLLLFAWEELTYEQIAETLGIPLGTVRSRLSRARQRVREHIDCAGQEEIEPARRHNGRCLP